MPSEPWCHAIRRRKKKHFEDVARQRLINLKFYAHEGMAVAFLHDQWFSFDILICSGHKCFCRNLFILINWLQIIYTEEVGARWITGHSESHQLILNQPVEIPSSFLVFKVTHSLTKSLSTEFTQELTRFCHIPLLQKLTQFKNLEIYFCNRIQFVSKLSWSIQHRNFYVRISQYLMASAKISIF